MRATESKMARTAAKDSSGTFLPADLKTGLRKACWQALGAALFALGVAICLALATFDAGDPSFNKATGAAAHNLLGKPGSYAADFMLQSMGLTGWAFALVFAVWGWRLAMGKRIDRPWISLTLLPLGLIFLMAALAAMPAWNSWPLKVGLGGHAGAVIFEGTLRLIRDSGLGTVSVPLAGTICFALALLFLVPALSIRWSEWRSMGKTGAAGIATGVAASVSASVSGLRRVREARTEPEQGERRQPMVRRAAAQPDNDPAPKSLDDPAEGMPAPPRFLVEPPAAPPWEKPEAKSGAKTKAKPAGQQRTLDLGKAKTGDGSYELPPLKLLAQPRQRAQTHIDEDALSQNAALLETVLQDFGVKGDVTRVHPGPVVTRYEFVPAPGTKSARIINLSDDIARSMSAVSVRVSVIPGQNALGIELPNDNREMVFLRDLLDSETIEASKAKLPLAIGKDIAGKPVIADLARMPHLLVAGTTGAGKSVSINTMILSLLYRLGPDRCKFIMIDPKMLELSTYDGIPQLLTPVVTEPAKAVVALKWTVREMEGRYQMMAKLGVRNVEGYNTRVAEAKAKGEVLRRKVQTGFDAETGKPTYEEQTLDLEPLPYIVVIVDEMADLMLVAGKDIEATIQRLAQMARAAGIHVIMATQRPSVDVITGTIKANFPSRISFQVTSKIDSRTILGEQGAETLLGQGDMLYMAGGGRITRVHGPFVSDEEVEKVVKYLKTQGQPEYIESITQDDDQGSMIPGMGGDDGDELYNDAVQLVLRERKASTSFVQRHLQIGYNRAARLIDQMEADGLIGPANHVGKREILAQ